MGSARQDILSKLKNSVHPEPEQPDFDTSVYLPIDKSLDLLFKESLEAVNGSVYLCPSEQEVFKKIAILLKKYSKEQVACLDRKIEEQLLKQNISFSYNENLPKTIEVGITSCEFLIARTGSVMVSSALNGGRQLFFYPPVHIIIANKSQLVDYLGTAYSRMQQKYEKQLPSQITLITGPSRTADIEKTLVLGAHGPRELHVFVF